MGASPDPRQHVAYIRTSRRYMSPILAHLGAECVAGPHAHARPRVLYTCPRHMGGEALNPSRLGTIIGCWGSSSLAGAGASRGGVWRAGGGYECGQSAEVELKSTVRSVVCARGWVEAASAVRGRSSAPPGLGPARGPPRPAGAHGALLSRGRPDPDTGRAADRTSGRSPSTWSSVGLRARIG